MLGLQRATSWNVLGLQKALCGVRPPTKLSVPAESAFYRRFHISNQQSLAYKKLLKGLGVQVLQSFSAVVPHQESLKLSDSSVTLKTCTKIKKSTKSLVPPRKLKCAIFVPDRYSSRYLTSAVAERPGSHLLSPCLAAAWYLGSIIRRGYGGTGYKVRLLQHTHTQIQHWSKFQHCNNAGESTWQSWIL